MHYHLKVLIAISIIINSKTYMLVLINNKTSKRAWLLTLNYRYIKTDIQTKQTNKNQISSPPTQYAFDHVL